MAPTAWAHPTSGRRCPSTRDTRCSTPAIVRADISSGQRDAAGLADTPEVVALEVHDHDVLRGVFRGATQCGSAAARPCALDRHRPDAATAPGQEQLGGGRGDGPSIAVERAPVERRERRQRGPDPGRIAFERGGEVLDQVDLVDLARGDGLACGRDGTPAYSAGCPGRRPGTDPEGTAARGCPPARLGCGTPRVAAPRARVAPAGQRGVPARKARSRGRCRRSAREPHQVGIEEPGPAEPRLDAREGTFGLVDLQHRLVHTAHHGSGLGSPRGGWKLMMTRPGAETGSSVTSSNAPG